MLFSGFVKGYNSSKLWISQLTICTIRRGSVHCTAFSLHVYIVQEISPFVFFYFISPIISASLISFSYPNHRLP